MEGKTVLFASVTGTVTTKDDKDPEVSCWHFLKLAQLSEETAIVVAPNGETYRYNELFNK